MSIARIEWLGWGISEYDECANGIDHLDVFVFSVMDKKGWIGTKSALHLFVIDCQN
jgi:hypothetical protein